jgi:hypothetical protein
MTRKSLFVLATGVVAALAVGGTALASGPSQGFVAATPVPATSTPPSSTPATPTSDVSGGGTDAVDSARAIEIALGRVGGGMVTEVERERENGRPVWSVEISKDGIEYEVDVDRATGQVVGSERDNDQSERHDQSERDNDQSERDNEQSERDNDQSGRQDDQSERDDRHDDDDRGRDDRGHDD